MTNLGHEFYALIEVIFHLNLIGKIEIFHIEGTGKNKTKRLIIHYRFVGNIEIPDSPQVKHTLDTRQGVSVTYQAIAV